MEEGKEGKGEGGRGRGRGNGGDEEGRRGVEGRGKKEVTGKGMAGVVASVRRNDGPPLHGRGGQCSRERIRGTEG